MWTDARCYWWADCWGSRSSRGLRTTLCPAHNSPDTLFLLWAPGFWNLSSFLSPLLLFSNMLLAHTVYKWGGVGWGRRIFVYCAMTENELIRCPCSGWPTVLKPPDKVIYEPVKRKTDRGLEGWISGLGIATIFHHYQAIPGGLVKHLVIPHSPVCRCCWPYFVFFFVFLTGTKLKALWGGHQPLEGDLALFCCRVFPRSFSLQHSENEGFAD